MYYSAHIVNKPREEFTKLKPLKPHLELRKRWILNLCTHSDTLNLHVSVANAQGLLLHAIAA